MPPEVGPCPVAGDESLYEAVDDFAAPSLGESVRAAVERYFDALDGHEPHDLYDLVLAEVERPFLSVVMLRVGGNVTRAAALLGINRATLRRKLQKYGLES